MPEEKTNKQKIKRDKTKTFTSLKMKQKASKKKAETLKTELWDLDINQKSHNGNPFKKGQGSLTLSSGRDTLLVLSA